MLNLNLYKDKRVRLYELADMEDMDNLIDMKFTEISIQQQKLTSMFIELQQLIVQRRTEEFNFLNNRKKHNKKR